MMNETLFAEPLQNMCLLYGFFGGMIGLLCLGWICFPNPSQQATLSVVDWQTLLSKEPGQAQRLSEDLKVFAAAQNLILLTKEAVMGGDMPDQTVTFLDWLRTRKQEGES